MEILTIMVISSIMNDRSGCYVKVVKTNYHDNYEGYYPKIHLIFLSKRDYNKINEIDKMIEKYYELEENKKKEFILYCYLKEIIRYLKECEVMEVFSDHIEAFHLKFHYISKFLDKLSINPDEENVSERMNKKIFKVIRLLFVKISFQ